MSHTQQVSYGYGAVAIPAVYSDLTVSTFSHGSRHLCQKAEINTLPDCQAHPSKQMDQRWKEKCGGGVGKEGIGKNKKEGQAPWNKLFD